MTQWVDENLLTINLEKTYYMYYNKTKNKKRKEYETNTEKGKLYINNIMIKQVHNINFLGIVIDDNLDFKEHTLMLISPATLLVCN